MPLLNDPARWRTARFVRRLASLAALLVVLSGLFGAAAPPGRAARYEPPLGSAPTHVSPPARPRHRPRPNTLSPRRPGVRSAASPTWSPQFGGSLLWNTSLAYFNTPVVAGNTLYVVGCPGIGNNCGGGNSEHLYAIDATTGATLWDDVGGFSGVAFVANGIVYVSEYGAAVDAFNATTGAPFKQYQNVGGGGDPVVSGGLLYASTQNHGTPATLDPVDLSTGTFVWPQPFQFPHGDQQAAGRVVVGPTDVYVVSLVFSGTPPNETQTSYVYALNPADGSLVWSFQLPVLTNPSGTPIPRLALDGGALYVAYECEGANCIGAGVVGAGANAEPLYALNAGTGAVLWNTASFNDMTAPFALGGVVYFAAWNDSSGGPTATNLYAVKSTGATLWQVDQGTQIPFSLAYDGTDLYEVLVPSTGGTFCGPYSANMSALSTSDGSTIWSQYIGCADNFRPAGFDTGDAAAAGGRTYYPAACPLATAATGGMTACSLLGVGPPGSGPRGSERLGNLNPSELGCAVQCSGDPVDTYSGNFTTGATDLAVPGRGPPLAFTRTYNAQAAATAGPLGYGWSDSYDMALAVNGTTGAVTITQENGGTVTFTPDGSGGYTAPPRVLATLVHNGDGTYTLTRAHDRTSDTFDPAGPLLRETNRNGYATTLAYLGAGTFTVVTDPAGRQLTLSYSGGRLVGLTDPIGRTVAYTYDASGNLASVTDPSGAVTRYTYDAAHRLLTITDPNGGVTTNTYDGSGRVTTQRDPRGGQTTYAYTPGTGGYSYTTITDPTNLQTCDSYLNGLLVQQDVGCTGARVWQYVYGADILGLTLIDDPNGGLWLKSYDLAGHLLNQADPIGGTVAYSYDALGDVTSQTDGDGLTTTYTYDAAGNLLTSSRPLAGTSQVQTTSYAHGDAAHPGDVTGVTDPLGHTTTYTYDADGDVASVTDPLGGRTTYQYNAIGWRTAVTPPDGNVPGGVPALYTITTTYDADGRPLTSTDPLGGVTTHQYDAGGRQTRLVDADGHATTYTYDAGGNITRMTRPDGSAQTATYDGDGNLLSQTDGLGHTTTYTYDALGDLAAVGDPLGRGTGYFYDAAGNRVQTNAAGQATYYTYDAANELTGIAYSGTATPNVTYAYDPAGLRTTMTDGTGTTTYTYDGLHRLTGVTDGAGHTLGYVYDLADQPTGLAYPNGRTVTRAFDAAGRLTSVSDWLGHTTRYGYDAAGQLIIAHYPNGVTGTWTNNRAGLMLRVAYLPPIPPYHGEPAPRPPLPLLGFTYTRDPLGLVTAVNGIGSTLDRQSYAYTALNQVSAASGAPYAYDHADDPTTLAEAAGAATLIYDVANEATTLTRAGATTHYAYDARGDRTGITPPSGPTTTLTYDQANRLTAYGTTATYAYDGNGLRTRKTVNGVAEAYVWDTAGGLPQLLQDGTTDFVYGPGGQPLEQISGAGSELYFLADQLGSIRGLVDANARLVATYVYDAYGTATHRGTATTPLQFSGQYADAESGYLYLRGRYYDPTTAQFLTRDPLTRDTHEPYAYAFDSPLTLADPTGLCGGYDLTGPNAWPPGSIVDVTQPPPPPDPTVYSVEDTTLTLSGAAGWLLTNAGTIGSFCDLGSFIPGVDAVAGPCALVFGTINGVEDIAGGKPVQGVLELAGGGLTVRSAALAGRAEQLTEAGNITEGVGAWNAHLTTEHYSQVLDLASGSLDLNDRTRAYFNQQNGNQGGG